MWLLIAEALLALALLVGIVAWTMGAARRRGTEEDPAETPAPGAEPEPPPSPPPPPPSGPR